MSLCECEVIEAVLLGRDPWSVLDPMDKVPQDENKTKSSHSGRQFLCDTCQFQLLITLEQHGLKLSKTYQVASIFDGLLSSGF